MKMHIVNKLQEMKDAGGAWQRMAKGDQVLAELRDLLPGVEYDRVSIARGHYQTGEGRVELDQVCNELMLKYREDRYPRNFYKTTL